MQEPLSTNVSATQKVLIKPVVEHFDENADMCAINWFDLKTPWMYQLYGLIASIFVRKVRGRLYFKGNLVKKIEGPEDRQHNMNVYFCGLTNAHIAREKSGQQQKTKTNINDR